VPSPSVVYERRRERAEVVAERRHALLLVEKTPDTKSE